MPQSSPCCKGNLKTYTPEGLEIASMCPSIQGVYMQEWQKTIDNTWGSCQCTCEMKQHAHGDSKLRSNRNVEVRVHVCSLCEHASQGPACMCGGWVLGVHGAGGERCVGVFMRTHAHQSVCACAVYVCVDIQCENRHVCVCLPPWDCTRVLMII